jgi:HTH-type transcriptional regulator/antitoxin HipB
MASPACFRQKIASYNLQFMQNCQNMLVMTDAIRLPDDLGTLLKTQRELAGLSKTELAHRAGKVREVIYRLEAGEDVTVSSLLAVLAALGLALRVEKAGMPSMQEVAARFADDDEDDSGGGHAS